MTLTIVTGADASFARTLAQFLMSIRRRRLHHGARIAVYDLGLTKAQHADLTARFGFVEFLPFSFSEKPAHVAVEAGTFAWKPLAIADAAARFGGRLFWFDSATLFHGSLRTPRSSRRNRDLYA
jgi:hypothetical protein